jgi:hypothetical protein
MPMSEVLPSSKTITKAWVGYMDAVGHELVVKNSLARYYEKLQEVAARFDDESLPIPVGTFRPRFALPALSSEIVEYLSASDISFAELGEYRGVSLHIMNLMGNPETQTTKTFASLLMVLRAVSHIQRTGERVLLVTPSSANKATALRNAVQRAIQAGLVTDSQLRIAVVVPKGAVLKLRLSPLDADADSRRRNPVVVFDGVESSGVKDISREAVECLLANVETPLGFQIWYTLDVNNYLLADSVRAFAEADAYGSQGASRVHAHAVSSAYGLLGHNLGWNHLSEISKSGVPRPEYLLVQQLATPDMVLGISSSKGRKSEIPNYAYNEDRSRFEQDSDVHFPAYTTTLDDEIDPTFYTHNPPTLPRMIKVLGEHGGDGIVVSSDECRDRYADIAGYLTKACISLPADRGAIRENSLVMGFTGALNAIERDIVRPSELLLHGSGHYTRTDFDRFPVENARRVQNSAQVANVLREAISG